MERKKSSGRAGTGFIKKLAVASVLTVAGLIIFSLTLFHLIPAHLYESWLSETIRDRSGFRVESASFATAFPLAFRFEGLKVFDAAGKEMLRMDSLKAGLNPIGLFSGLRIDLEGEASGGQVSGTARTGLFGSSFDMDVKGVGFDALSLLSSAGIKFDGAFDAVLAVKLEKGCPRGSLKAQGVEFREAELSFRGMPLPIGSVDEAGLSAEFFNCGVRLDGLWIESKDLSARLKGNIKLAAPVSASPVDMTLELVPNEGLLRKEYLLSLLSTYKRSANYYSIPVKGTLGGLSAGR
ncbi:MAG: type II secretion system protein GspN [Deltaproteobacteria bacterium]|nr:type II secretion system protein GspN [Deltaproteobacteria bacterium]